MALSVLDYRSHSSSFSSSRMMVRRKLDPNLALVETAALPKDGASCYHVTDAGESSQYSKSQVAVEATLQLVVDSTTTLLSLQVHSVPFSSTLWTNDEDDPRNKDILTTYNNATDICNSNVSDSSSCSMPTACRTIPLHQIRRITLIRDNGSIVREQEEEEDDDDEDTDDCNQQQQVHQYDDDDDQYWIQIEYSSSSKDIDDAVASAAAAGNNEQPNSVLQVGVMRNGSPLASSLQAICMRPFSPKPPALYDVLEALRAIVHWDSNRRLELREQRERMEAAQRLREEHERLLQELHQPQ